MDAYGHNAVHNVEIGFDHLGRMVNYFFGAVSSPFSIPCYLLASFGVIGLASIIRQESWHAVVFLCFPLLYILLFAVHRGYVRAEPVNIDPRLGDPVREGCVFPVRLFSWEPPLGSGAGHCRDSVSGVKRLLARLRR